MFLCNIKSYLLNKYIFALVFFFALNYTLFAQIRILEPQYRTQPLPFGLSYDVPKQKPKIAFVFSGGGARGAAQVGILRALIENNIYPDLIVGTSIGSIVGGLFASGYSINDLENIIKTTKWDEILISEERQRKNLFIEQKLIEDKNLLTLRLDGFTPILPRSFSSGAKILNHLNTLVLNAPIISNNFDSLRYPFRAVCTDLISGKPVIPSKGNLAEVMRASSSVSFLLDPIKIDSFLLADGGMSSNIPVNIAKSLGADFVIAISTTSPLRISEQLDKVWYLADQVVSIPMKQIESIDLKNADAIIAPELVHLSTDFSGLDSLVLIGYEYAKKIIPQIKQKLDARYHSSFQNDFTYYTNFQIENINEIDSSFFSKYYFKERVGRKEINEFLNTLFLKNGCKPQLIVKREKDTTKAIILCNYPGIVENIYLNSVDINQYKNESKYFEVFLGKPFNPVGLVDSIISLIKYYKNTENRLINCKSISFSEKDRSIDIDLTSDFVDEILITGNENTSNMIIRREILANEGEVISLQNIQKTFDNINSTNLFESSLVELISNNKNTLKLKVKEKNTGLLRFGIRADNERNLQVAIDVREENFLGRATELGFFFYGGLRNRNFGVENLSNRIFNTFLSYKLKAYYELVDKNVYTNSPEVTPQNWDRIKTGEYKSINYGLKLSLGTQVEKLGNIFFEFNRYKSLIRTISGSFNNEQNLNLFTIKFGALFDSRNTFPFPTDGIYLESYYETSIKTLGGEIGYSKIFFKYESYFTYYTIHTLKPKFIFGFGDETLPLSEQFFLGGQNSFLGLREDDLYGRQIFLASLEYRIKLPFKLFFDSYLSFRYDLGGAWQTPAAIRYIELRHGMGGSLGFDTPIGSANFSVGRGFYIRNDILKRPISFGPTIFYFELGYPL